MANVVIGLDYGQKRIGVATLHGVLAQPHSILSNSDQIFASIAALCNELQCQTIVLGLSEGKSAQRTQAFGQQLSVYLEQLQPQSATISIIFFDETLSTQNAYKTALGQRRVRAHEPVDDISAALILEEWEAAGRPGLSTE